MKEERIVVNNKVGLHARPAAVFVQEANKYASEISVSATDPDTNENRKANAKSILGILTLGVFQGMEIVIKAEGNDEDAAIASLVKLVEDDFGEE